MVKKQTYIPVSNIVPLVFREGASLLELIHGLAKYVQDTLEPSLKHVVDNVVAEVESQMDQAKADYVSGVQEFQRIHDAFMSDVNSSLKALNDGAVTDLVDDRTSLLGTTLRELFPDRQAVEDLFSKTLFAVDGYTLYVNGVTGSDSNTGESGSPFETIEHAIDVALEQTTRPDQEATIRVASGTYAPRIQFPDTTPYPYRLRIKGDDVGGVNVRPSTIMTRGEGAVAIAFVNRNPHAHITFEDIVFKGYNGSRSSGGINNNNGTMVSINCHYEQCYYGASSFHGNLTIPTGVFRECGYDNAGNSGGAGVRSMMQNRHSVGIQNNGSRNGTVLFEDNAYGFSASENSTGHVDWSTFRGNSRGVVCSVSSRVNADGSLFEDNTIAIYLQYGSNAFISGNTEIVKSDTQAGVVALSNSTFLANGADGVSNSAYAKTQQFLRGEYTQKTVSNTEDTIFRQKFPESWFDGTKGLTAVPATKLSTKTLATASGSGSKTFRVAHLGYSQEVSLGSSFTGPIELTTEVSFISPTRQVVSIALSGHLNNPIMRVTERSRDMDQSFDLHILASTESGGELTVHSTEVSGVL